jgi:outer membrane autotransporter protein
MSDIRTIAWAAAVAVAVTLSAPAGAADLRRPPPLAYVPPPIIWTGFHVGAHAGFAFSGEDATSAFFGTPVTFSTNPSGVLGGLEAGYDYQFSPNWLVGAELDLSWTTASGNFNFITTTPAGAVASGIFNSNHHWYDTFTGRVGYLISDWVLYAKGGAAWINADYNLAVNGPFGGGSVNDTRTGYALGLGAEWMFGPGWSTKLEYDYLGFGNNSYALAGFGTTVNTHVQQIKVGVNYHLLPGAIFGWF